MKAEIIRLLATTTHWALTGFWLLWSLSLPLLIIGLTAICRAERRDIPAVLRALAVWLPWGVKNNQRG